MLAGEVKAITRRCIELALEGDGTALRLCMERLLPPARSRAIMLDLPRVTDAAASVEAMAHIIEAVSKGEITVDEAASLASVLETARRLVELVDLEARISALEASTNAK